MIYPVEKTGDELIHLFVGQKKGVMTPTGIYFTETDITAVFFERGNDCPGLVGRVQPVRGKDQKADMRKFIVDQQITVATLQVKIVPGLRYIEQGVCIEPGNELGPLVA